MIEFKNKKMGIIQTALGIEPKQVKKNIYTPSISALNAVVNNTSDYDHTKFKQPYKGNKLKILIIGTEHDELLMENGKKFLTGNHPIELFVPMLHLQNAGFDFDFATPTGQPMKLELWAFPKDDEDVEEIYRQYQYKIEHPMNLEKVAKTLDENSKYIAVFIPGGHGVLIDLPDSVAVKDVIQWSKDFDKFIITLCHGPAAFISTGINTSKENYPYKGYKIVAFPDGMDKLLPAMGYLPGRMPMFFGEKLEELGM
jgi:molecular chaperone Hsp31 and glyoxalase 3